MPGEPQLVGYEAALIAAKAGKQICRKFMLSRPSLNRLSWSETRGKLAYVREDGTEIVGCNISKIDEAAQDWVILD